MDVLSSVKKFQGPKFIKSEAAKAMGVRFVKKKESSEDKREKEIQRNEADDLANAKGMKMSPSFDGIKLPAIRQAKRMFVDPGGKLCADKIYFKMNGGSVGSLHKKVALQLDETPKRKGNRSLVY